MLGRYTIQLRIGYSWFPKPLKKKNNTVVVLLNIPWEAQDNFLIYL